MQLHNTLRLCLILLSFEMTIEMIHVRNGRIVDSLGAELIFHGLNIVEKSPPYITNYNETDMKYFQSIGVNAVRLGVMWPGVEPQRGEWNYTYLKLMRQAVELAGKYGIYTLVEFHQDIFSQKFCADGVPLWAVPKEIYHNFPIPLEKHKYLFDNVTGRPNNSDCSKHPWSEYYMSDSVTKGFAALWKNKYNLRDMFIGYWKKVAETFKGSEYVIAYEICNEPWPGNVYKDIFVLIPGLSQLLELQPAYDIIAHQIRAVDPDHSICFEPVTWLNGFPSMFSHPPGGKAFANTSIFCYHYYNPPTFHLQKFMNARMKDIKRLKVGGLISEMYQDNEQIMNLCDDNLQSWFGWLYNSVNGQLPRQMQSSKFTEVLPKMIRTFAPRVAGVTISQKYQPTTKKFTLLYSINKSSGDTLIYVSEKTIYTTGFSIQCYPKDQVSCERVEDYAIRVRGLSIEDGQMVKVTIFAV